MKENFLSTEDEYKIIFFFFLMKKKALSYSTQRHGHFKLHLLGQVAVLTCYNNILFDSNKYNPIIQYIAVLMGLVLSVRLKYLFYLLNLRIICLKVPFGRNREVI